MNIFSLYRRLTEKQMAAGCLAAILVATVIAYSPVLHAGFISIDDGMLVSHNALVAGLSLKSLPGLFTSFYGRLYHPLVLLSYGLEYRMFGLEPGAYHAVNLMLHLANVLLVYLFFALLTDNAGSALLVAALFALHPQHVESVAWISERKDVLYAFFFLASLAFYIRYIRRGAGRDYCLSFAAFLLSLLSKPMAITLPLVLPLCDYYLGIRFERKRLVEKTPFVVLFIIFAVITHRGFYSGDYRNLPALYPLYKNFLAAGFGFLFYLGKIIFPRRLSFGYPFLDWVTASGPFILIGASVFAVLTVLAALGFARRDRALFFGFFFFLVTLSPALQLLLSGMRFVADKYSYVPALGIFFLVARALPRLPVVKYRVALGFLLLLVVTGFGFASYGRCRVWKNSVSLFTDILEKYPDYSIYRNDRGIEYLNAGQYAEAAADFQYILRHDAGFWWARLNLGVLYMSAGNYQRAITCFDEVLLMSPANAQGYARRAEAYLALGDYRRAARDTARSGQLDAKPGEGLATITGVRN